MLHVYLYIGYVIEVIKFIVLGILFIYTSMFYMAQQPPVGQGLLTVEASRSHSDTPQSVGLLWTRDQLVAETST